MKIPVEEQPAFKVPYPEGQPFMISCSRDHKAQMLLHRGVLVTKEDGSREIAWVIQGRLGEPQMGPIREDGDRTVFLRCGDRRTCRLDRQFSMSGLIKSVDALAEAGLKDHKGRVCLDIAHLSYSFDNWPPPEADWKWTATGWDWLRRDDKSENPQ